ncbi:MAG: hypothetical protein WCP82_07960 [Alphaproteobacteria bacterium]
MDTAKGVAHTVGRVIPSMEPSTEERVLTAVLGPAGPLVGDIVKGHIETAKKAAAAAKKGNYAEAAGYGAATILPALGPAAAGMAEQMAATNPDGTPIPGAMARGIGQVAGMAALPEVVEALPSRIGIKPLNPVEARAVEFGADRGVPLSAGAATGNKFIQHAQTAADMSPIGSVIAEKSKAAQVQALQRVSGELADQSHPTAVVPEQAGEAVQSMLKTKSDFFKGIADQNYRDFQRVMDSPQATRMAKWNGYSMDPIQAPVEVGLLKNQMQKAFEQMEMMPAAQKSASAGYNALKELVNGPNQVPATTAELALSYFKEMARDTDGRTQGISKQLVARLQPLVDAAVKDVGPSAFSALEAGRKATRMQKEVQAVEKTVRAEPVQAFGQMVYGKDAGIEHLRRINNEIPSEIPKVGRALLEDIFSKATFEGGFDKMDSGLAKWRDLGPETKRILFKNPALIADLDNFFHLAKKANHDTNPSGSAKLGGVMAGIGYAFKDPVSGAALVIGTGALSKLLHSPTVVRSLTEGMRVPLKDAGRAASVATRIRGLVGDAAVPLDKVADKQSDQKEAGKQP